MLFPSFYLSGSLSTTAAVAELTRLGAADSAMMIQPFMPSVVQDGEISVFVFNGKVGHAVRSNTQPDDYRVQFEHGGITTALKEISTEILELVHAVIAVCPEIPVYARVDMIRNSTNGGLCIIELELIEPNLFLEHAPDEGMAFARAVLQASSQNLL
jgi:glutathione synthase/RimK-type ligase-like ATP-grasp enzyme